MRVPVQDPLPDLTDKPTPDPLEPERTELASGIRAACTSAGWRGPPTYYGGLLKSAPDRTDLRASGYKRRSNMSRAERRQCARSPWPSISLSVMAGRAGTCRAATP